MGKKNITLCVLLFLILLTNIGNASGDGSTIFDWYFMESDNFLVFYPEGYADQALEVAFELEKSLPQVQKLTGNQRKIKTHIIIQDMGIYTNGYSQHWNHEIGIYTNPAEPPSELAGYQNWYRLISRHELTHDRQLSNYSGGGAILPAIFGELWSANGAVPQWLMEGITIYVESQASVYEGRLHDGYYDALLAAKVRAGKLPNILEANYAHNHYPHGQWYLYGASFVEYLAETYGEDSLAAFFTDYGKNSWGVLAAVSPRMGLDQSARRVFGKAFPQLFRDWKAMLTEKYKNWQIDGEEVIARAGSRYLNLTSYQDRLYYVQEQVLTPGPNQSQVLYKLVEYNPETKAERILQTIRTYNDNSLEIKNDQIYYATFDLEAGYPNFGFSGNGMIAKIYTFDLNTHEKREILAGPIKAFTVLEDGDIIYCIDRSADFGSEIWHYSTRTEKKIRLAEVDSKITQIIGVQKDYIIVGRERNQSWNISRLNGQDWTLASLVQTPWSEVMVRRKGDLLYFSANYDHVYGIYTYHLQTGEVNRLTNGGYALNGVPVKERLYFTGVMAEGEGIFQKQLAPIPYQLTGNERDVEEVDFVAFASTLERGKALEKDMSYLLKPYGRLLPYLAQGSDGIGFVNYVVTLSPYLGLDYHWQFIPKQPIQVGIDSVKISDQKRLNSLSATLPLYRSLDYGLDNVYVMGSTDLNGNVVTNLTGSYYLPRQRLDFFMQHQFPSRGFVGEINYQYQLERGHFQLRGTIFDNSTVVVDLHPALRLTDEGYALSAEVTQRLAQVRDGLWGANFFVGDLYGSLFMDYARSSQDLMQGGLEIAAETGNVYLATIVQKIGMTLNMQGEIKPYLQFGLDF